MGHLLRFHSIVERGGLGQAVVAWMGRPMNLEDVTVEDVPSSDGGYKVSHSVSATGTTIHRHSTQSRMEKDTSLGFNTFS